VAVASEDEELLFEPSRGQLCPAADRLVDDRVTVAVCVAADEALPFEAARACPTPKPPNSALVATVVATTARRTFEVMLITSFLRRPRNHSNLRRDRDRPVRKP
jgi:hypothetical protein